MEARELMMEFTDGDLSVLKNWKSDAHRYVSNRLEKGSVEGRDTRQEEVVVTRGRYVMCPSKRF